MTRDVYTHDVTIVPLEVALELRDALTRGVRLDGMRVGALFAEALGEHASPAGLREIARRLEEGESEELTAWQRAFLAGVRLTADGLEDDDDEGEEVDGDG